MVNTHLQPIRCLSGGSSHADQVPVTSREIISDLAAAVHSTDLTTSWKILGSVVVVIERMNFLYEVFNLSYDKKDEIGYEVVKVGWARNIVSWCKR